MEPVLQYVNSHITAMTPNSSTYPVPQIKFIQCIIMPVSIPHHMQLENGYIYIDMQAWIVSLMCLCSYTAQTTTEPALCWNIFKMLLWKGITFTVTMFMWQRRWEHWSSLVYVVTPKKRYRKRISHSRERCPQSEYRKVVARCIQRSAKDLFYHVYMEDMDLLDPENNCLLFCLHYIFIPQIDTFTNGSRHGYQ